MSADDLAALTNRGTVKCAQRELDSGMMRLENSSWTCAVVTCELRDGIRRSHLVTPARAVCYH